MLDSIAVDIVVVFLNNGHFLLLATLVINGDL